MDVYKKGWSRIYITGFQPWLYILYTKENPYLPSPSETQLELHWFISIIQKTGGPSYLLILEFLALPIISCMRKYGELIFQVG